MSFLFPSAARWGTKIGPGKGRGPLNTKRAPHMKKGRGAIGLGHHTKKGFFHINHMLVPMFKVHLFFFLRVLL